MSLKDKGARVVTLSAIFTPDQPPEQILPVAAAAEAAGMTHLWVWEDCFSESGIATAAAMLATTSRLTVGIGLLPVPLRNVALTAMELATVSRLFPGRLMPGIGHGVLSWMGQVGVLAESPLTLLREYTAALYALLHGETVTVHGRYVSLDEVKLDWPPAVPPPLLVGGVKPRTVALAGELADGVIISSGPSPDEIRATAGHFRASRPDGAGSGDVVVFTHASADSPARDIAAMVSEYAAAGATHVAVNADERDAGLERFVTLLAREVSPLVRSG